MELRYFIMLIAIDRRQRDGDEVLVVLPDQRADLARDRALLARLRKLDELLGRSARPRDDVAVVLDVATVPLDDRVGLVDVLLAYQRGDAVAGVLGVIQRSDLALRFCDLAHRVKYDAEREREKQQHPRERRTEALDGRRAQKSAPRARFASDSHSLIG
jgi:hypothetical protein